MRVTVALAWRELQEVVAVALPEGATVGDALAASGLAARFPGFDIDHAPVGLWSRSCDRGTVLREGDRVEVYRPLEADAKALRRSRVVRPSKRARSAR